MMRFIAENPLTVHGSAVLFEDKGLLCIGDSGSGKSDLCLRLIDAGGRLIADDAVILKPDMKGGVRMSPVPAIAGLIEVRGFGLVKLPFIGEGPLDFILRTGKTAPRLPKTEKVTLCGLDFPVRRLQAFESSVLAKIKLLTRGAEFVR